jgi:hypothetical protein
VVVRPEEADFILMHGTEALALAGGRGVQAASLDELAALLRRCARLGRALPLLVANPDLATVDGAALVTMPGTLARWYRGGRRRRRPARGPTAPPSPSSLRLPPCGRRGRGGGSGWRALSSCSCSACHGSRRRLPPPLLLLLPLLPTRAPAPAEAGGEVHLMGKPAPVIYGEAAELLGLQPGELLAIGDSLEHDVAGAAALGADTLLVVGGIHAAEVGLNAAAGCWDQERLRQLAGSYGVVPTYALPYLAY